MRFRRLKPQGSRSRVSSNSRDLQDGPRPKGSAKCRVQEGSSTSNVSASGYDQGTIVCSYPGWREDKLEVEEKFKEEGDAAASHLLEGMRRKQRLFEGDRSHPEIVALDRCGFNYPGWLRDKKELEDLHSGQHCKSGHLVACTLETMKRKQALNDGDRSHQLLRNLDDLRVSYPGWEEDKQKVEDKYIEDGEKMAKDILEGMRRKQRLFQGDRSHPEIVALDKCNFNYPAWERDKKNLEKLHSDQFCRNGHLVALALESMQRKQALSDGDRSHQVLRQLDALRVSYPGWEEDRQKVEDVFIENGVKSSNHLLEGMRRKQRLFEGDRSHPEIQALDCCDFTYFGWEADRKELMDRHCGQFCKNGYLFANTLKSMRRKQALSDGNRSHQIMQSVDAIHSCSESVQLADAKPPCSVLNTSSDSAPLAGEESTKCAVCFEQDRSHVFVPCGHRCVCGTCAAKMQSRRSRGSIRCPICRKKASSIMKVYL